MSVWLQRQLEGTEMNVEKRERVMSWGISLLVHVLALAAASSAGLFLLGQRPVEPAVVDVALLPESGQQMEAGRPADGEQAAPAASSGAGGMVMPAATDVPEIRETYTRDSEKQSAYRQAHHVAADGTVVEPSDQPVDSGHKGGSSTGSAATAANGRADSNGVELGNGAGDSSSNGGMVGGGTASVPPVPPERIMAVCKYRPEPVYPESLRAQGIEGRVQVQIMVAADNTIEAVEILRSSGYPAMDQAALRAAWGCRFQMNGYLGRYTTTYRFSLNGGDDW